MKILIIDDDAICVKVLKNMLSKYGAADVAANGQEALDLFLMAHEAGSPYDLLLMDIMMPEADGLDTVQTIRKKEVELKVPQTSRVKIIMTTALDDPRTVIKALYESDANSYLVKPISMDKLLTEMRALKLAP